MWPNTHCASVSLSKIPFSSFIHNLQRTNHREPSSSQTLRKNNDKDRRIKIERNLFWSLKGFYSYLLVIWEIHNKQTNQKKRGKQKHWWLFSLKRRHGKLNFSADMCESWQFKLNAFIFDPGMKKTIQRNCQNVIFTLKHMKTTQTAHNIQIHIQRQLFGLTQKWK